MEQNLTNNHISSLRDNTQRAKIAVMLIWLVLGMELFSVTIYGLQYDVLQKMQDDYLVSDDEIDFLDQMESVLAVVYMAVFVLSGIAFIRWFRRAYYNLHQKVEHLSFSEGWAAGSWFVPFINWFRPYQIMKELYGETKKILSEKNLIFPDELSMKYLGWWWTLWIISSFIDKIIFKAPTTTVEQLVSLVELQITNALLGIILALITIKIIKDYAGVELLLNEKELLYNKNRNI